MVINAHGKISECSSLVIRAVSKNLLFQADWLGPKVKGRQELVLY